MKDGRTKIEFDYIEIVRNFPSFQAVSVCLLFCLFKSDCFFNIPLVKKEREKRKSKKNLGKNSKSRERLEKNFDIFYE